jgi:hypothetical protein
MKRRQYQVFIGAHARRYPAFARSAFDEEQGVSFFCGGTTARPRSIKAGWQMPHIFWLACG